ncbi:MAG: class I SAM-dependent methyltransferase [Nitrososphaeraceae archaeon]|nr:class I SAM-dependent methyltransferase [Nitrososphaeraceae archaeon]MBV9666845.1 class I SAM-dependent methyltransferase [Nitrososphaeraceae archaeon]
MKVNKNIYSVLTRLEEEANRERSSHVETPFEDRMLAISWDTGKFFNILLRTMRATRVLEIGTSVGYSTLWFADAVIQNASANSNGAREKLITTIDWNHLKITRAHRNFDDAGVNGIIDVVEAPAKRLLNEMQSKYQNYSKSNDQTALFDFVFIDADKENLMDYLDLVLPIVRVGGIIAADNALYPEEYRQAMTKYINYLRSKISLESVTVPIGNGEEITLKLK